ncbi:alpha/beta hydrolase [Hoeflea sp. CAU 1731]
MMIVRVCLLALLVALAAAGCKSGDSEFKPPAGPLSYTTERYVFDKFGNEVIVQKPVNAEGPIPWLFNVPGGGWMHRNTMPSYRFSQQITARGVAIVSTDYRLSDQATWPAQRVDVENGFEFARKNARKWGLDPDRYAVRGASAGSTEAAWLGITENPRCTVLYAPPLDFTTLQNNETTKMLGDYDARKASPLYAVHGGMSPTILVHGTRDDIVPFSQSVAYEKAVKQAGGQAELWRHDRGHVGVPSSLVTRVGDYIQQCLGATP